MKESKLFSDTSKRLSGVICVSVLITFAVSAQKSFRLEDYISNHIGSEWQFKNNVKDGMSPIIVSTSQNVMFGNVKTVRRDENNGDYRLQTVDRNGLTVYRLYFIGDRFIDYEEPVVLMPATFKIGDVFKSESRYTLKLKEEIKERGKQTYEVRIEKLENAGTSLRAFKDCLVVRTVALRVDDSGSQKGYELVEWIAKDFGSVKVMGELFWKDAEGKTTRVFKIDADLESYEKGN